MASYKDVPITPGTDAEVAAQVAAIDARGKTPAQGDPDPGTGGSGGGNPSDKGGNSAFISELQKSLMDQSGMVSSADSNIESSINEAIAGVKGAAELNKNRIESEYSRERGYKMDANATSEQAFLEGRTGYATPVVAFQNLREYNAKTIRDLDQRKNELIMQGDAVAAGKVAELTLQKLEFEQEAAQRTFTNLLATGSFALNVSADDRAERSFGLQERSQTFQESQAMSAIALQYGIKMEANDTLDTLVTKAMPMASEEQKLKLESVRSQIEQNRAQTKAALAQAARAAREDAPLDAASIAALAAAYRTPAGAAIVAGAVKDPKMLSQIFSASAGIEQTEVSTYVKDKMSKGAKLEDVLKDMQTDPSISINDFNGAATIAANLYADTPVVGPKGNSLPGIIGEGAVGYSGGVNSFLEWFTGVPQAYKY